MNPMTTSIEAVSVTYIVEWSRVEIFVWMRIANKRTEFDTADDEKVAKQVLLPEYFMSLL